MLKSVALAAVLLLAGLSAPAQTPRTVKPPDIDSTMIAVTTVKCQMCADAITSALHKVDGVKSAKVDLEAKMVKVLYYPRVVPVRLLERAIAYAGYDANKTKRIPAAYDKLPSCCK